MSTAVAALTEALLAAALRMLEKLGHTPRADQLETLRFEAKIEAQRLLVEHAGDLTLALKHAAQQKIGGG